jgi:hypothetical protein
MQVRQNGFCSMLYVMLPELEQSNPAFFMSLWIAGKNGNI